MDGATREHPSLPFRELTPRRAVVTPRVRPFDGAGDVLPIEDRVAALLRREKHGVVNLSGPAGSGKTSALAHLLAVLPSDASVRIFDDVTGADGWAEVTRAIGTSLALVTTSETPFRP